MDRPPYDAGYDAGMLGFQTIIEKRAKEQHGKDATAFILGVQDALRACLEDEEEGEETLGRSS